MPLIRRKHRFDVAFAATVEEAFDKYKTTTSITGYP